MNDIVFIRVDGSDEMAIIDVEDLPIVGFEGWVLGGNGYPRRGGVCMHELVFPVSRGLDTDHKDRSKMNNRRMNLRSATRSQNKANQGVRSDSRNNYKGVRRSGDRWSSRITRDGRSVDLGVFDSEVEAAEAYDRAAKIVFGDFAFRNFPETGVREEVLSRIRGHRVRLIP